jgi:serine/threonine protein phosphatase PrpC
MVFDVAGASAQGPRNENQDAFTVTRFPQLGLVAVADGMGGQRAGRVAAETAIEAVTAAGPIRSLDAARYAIRAADDAVAKTAGGDPAKLEGMGAALTVMALTQDRAGDVGWLVANVGDVRVISRAPDGLVRLETKDHTPAFARWEAGEIALDEIPDSPGANRLQRAVGHGGDADTTWIPVRPGWAYLVHSDGVTKTMRLDELGEAMALPSAAAACEAIARKVEERGPDDNYTAVVVRVLPDGAVPPGEATLPSPGLAARGDDATADRPRPAAAASPRPGPFNPPDDVRSTRSPLGGIATAVSVLALALGGYGLFTGMRAQGDANAARADAAALRTRVDSLQRLMAPDTAGRVPVTATDTGAKAANPALPPPPPAPAANRTNPSHR